jgi:PAS domain S-box-containing protein
MTVAPDKAPVLRASPWVWILAALSFAGVAWVGGTTPEAWAVAAGVSIMIVVSAGRRAVVQHEAAATARESVASRVEKTRLETVLGAIPGMVWQSDPESGRSFLSPSWLAVTGLDQEDAVGDGWLDAVHEDDRDRCCSAHRLAVIAHEPYEVRYRLRNADGTFRWVNDRAAPCFGEHGEFQGFAGLTLTEAHADDTDTRLADLAGMNDTINRQVMSIADRYEALDEAKSQAEYRDRVKSDFLVALGDDLHRALGELQNITGVLQAADLTDDLRPLVGRVAAATARLGVIDGQVSRYGESAAEDEPLALGRFDLRRMVDVVFQRQGQRAAEHDVAVTLKIDDAVPTVVEADPIRLRQLVIEMWVAMLRSARGGSIMFTLEHAPQLGDDSVIRFLLSHHGDGIDDALLERAFYPAEQVGSEPPGMGLAACRRLVEQMGGELGVQREESGAATIWFTVGLLDMRPNYDGRREHGRLAQELLMSNVGQVLDLSLGGMRVKSAQTLDGIIDVELSDEEETIVLPAEVAWSKRTGFGKHEIGIRFTHGNREVTAQLGRIATRNRLRRILDAA